MARALTLGEIEQIGAAFLSFLRKGRLSPAQVSYLVSTPERARYFEAMVASLRG